jgi:hypothetical protein
MGLTTENRLPCCPDERASARATAATAALLAKCSLMSKLSPDERAETHSTTATAALSGEIR